MKTRRILVPIDFSEHSSRALELALDLVKDSGGSLTLIHVGALPYYAAGEVGWTLIGPDIAGAMWTNLAKVQRQELEKLASEVLPDAVERHLVVLTGNPSEIICNEAESHDLVVMGTHGRGGLGRALLGSVTSEVVAKAPVPVLVTR